MTKTAGWLGCAFLVVLAPALYAEPADEAKAVVDRAIKAMGGEDKLAKTPATTFKCKGTVDEGGKVGSFSGDWSIQAPDKYHAVLEVVMGKTESVTLVISGDKAWAKTVNSTEDAPADAIHVIQADLGAIQLIHRLVALKDKDFELSHLGEVKIDNKAAVGIKVKRKDLPEVDVFFDKDSSLPVKAEVRVKEQAGADEKLHTFLFQDYKEADGVKYFSKLVLHRDDKEMMVMELSELKRLEKIEPTLFDKP